MRTRLIGLLAALVAFVVVPLGTGAGATDVAQPMGCAGTSTVFVGAFGNQPQLLLTFYCGIHRYDIDGTGQTTQPLDMCPGGPAVTVTFTGTDRIDGAPGIPSTLTLSGAGGVYSLSAGDAAANAWSGALVSTPSATLAAACDPSMVNGAASAVWSGPSRPTPDALVCQATGAEGPNTTFSGRSGFTLQGPAQGSGTCQSAAGSWSLTYQGQWSEGGAYGQADCPGTYDVVVTVTNTSTGASQSEAQQWVEPAAGPFAVTSGLVPIGLGDISETPGPCTFPAGMASSQTWAFALLS